jgi:hypothetical protein
MTVIWYITTKLANLRKGKFKPINHHFDIQNIPTYLGSCSNCHFYKSIKDQYFVDLEILLYIYSSINFFDTSNKLLYLYIIKILFLPKGRRILLFLNKTRNNLLIFQIRIKMQNYIKFISFYIIKKKSNKQTIF